MIRYPEELPIQITCQIKIMIFHMNIITRQNGIQLLPGQVIQTVSLYADYIKIRVPMEISVKNKLDNLFYHCSYESLSCATGVINRP